MRRTLMSIAAATVLLFLATSHAVAQPHSVMPGESIQAAIDQAAPGDEILVEAGRYNETIDLRGKPVTLRSIRGRHVTILDGAGLDNAVLRCVSGETPATLIEGFTITGGAGSSEYTPSRGGGLLIRCSSPTIRNCLFEANTAQDFGGGGYIIGETLAITPCPTSPTFEDCQFRHNTAARGAGLSTYFADIHLDRCAFLGNQGGSEGGGLRVNGGTVTVLNSEFVANAANRGGALFLVNTTPAPASASIIGCTITANLARITRGGVQVDIPLTLTNSILHADTAPEIFSFNAATTSVTHCLVQGGHPGAGNLAANPLFRRDPSPGPDNAWGTPDDDFGDLRLAPASPCIDRADGTAATLAGALTDAHDCPRDVDDPAAPNAGAGTPATIDLGAHERRTPIVVDAAGAGDHTSIQAAINAAEPCDEIIIRAGTYNEAIDFLGKPITVRGEAGPSQTILHGAGLATSIVRFVSGEDARARLEGVTITGSRGLCEAGGVRITNSSPMLVNCRITDNLAACPMVDNWGAGVFIHGGAPIIIGCEIDNNLVGFGDGYGATFGAGLYAEEASPRITDTAFHDNTTDSFFDDFDLGGGVCHFGPFLALENCTFLRNRIDSNGPNEGGGVYSDAVRLEIVNCDFVENFVGENAGGLGGGLRHTGAFAIIRDCDFSDNHVGSIGGSAGIGGGLFIENGRVERATFTGNTATRSPSGNGGGAAARNGTFDHCHFESNMSDGEAMGGGLVVFGDVDVIHTIFEKNESSGPGGAVAVDGGSATIVACTFDHNLLFDYPGGGAIALLSGTLDVAASTFKQNTGASEGGAIRITSGVADITESYFFANTASRGGAIFNQGGASTITSSTFTENIGCGAALWTSATALLQDNTFLRNFPDHVQGPYVDLGGNTGLPYADMDASGAVDVHDLLDYLDLWFTHAGTITDLLAFLDCWFSGDPAACPARPGPCE